MEESRKRSRSDDSASAAGSFAGAKRVAPLLSDQPGPQGEEAQLEAVLGGDCATHVVKLWDFDQRWQEPAQALHSRGAFHDVVLTVGAVRVPAHRFQLATISPYLEALFLSGMEDSRKEEIELQGLSGRAVQEIVNFGCATSALFVLPTFCSLCSTFYSLSAHVLLTLEQTRGISG